jgi:hypothetical protein
MLPKIQHPTLPLLVPSLNRAHRFRPFTVKEEKILLMARESDEPEIDHLRAIHQVVNNCSVDPELVIDDLATFDLEWLFLKLSAVSIKGTVPQSFHDVEERKAGMDPLPVYDFEIKLDDVIAPSTPFSTSTVTLESGDGIELRYPPALLYTDPEFVKNGEEAILYRSTKRIFTATESFDAQASTQAEVMEYYDGWSAKDMERVREFLASTPSMLYECKYVNSLGHDRVIKLTSLTDFFTF